MKTKNKVLEFLREKGVPNVQDNDTWFVNWKDGFQVNLVELMEELTDRLEQQPAKEWPFKCNKCGFEFSSDDLGHSYLTCTQPFPQRTSGICGGANQLNFPQPIFEQQPSNVKSSAVEPEVSDDNLRESFLNYYGHSETKSNEFRWQGILWYLSHHPEAIAIRLEQQPEVNDNVKCFELVGVSIDAQESVKKGDGVYCKIQTFRPDGSSTQYAKEISHHPQPISEGRIEELWNKYKIKTAINSSHIIGKVEFEAALKELNK